MRVTAHYDPLHRPLYAWALVAAQAPYMAGVERFNLTTVVATELMHLLSGAWIVGCFTRWAQLKVVDNRD